MFAKGYRIKAKAKYTFDKSIFIHSLLNQTMT